MKAYILRQYDNLEAGTRTVEYTLDGETVSGYSTFLIPNETGIVEPVEIPLTLEELQAQTLLNTELLVVYAEIGV